MGRLVVHLDTASIFEILVRLTGAQEQTGMYLPPSKVPPPPPLFLPGPGRCWSRLEGTKGTIEAIVSLGIRTD